MVTVICFVAAGRTGALGPSPRLDSAERPVAGTITAEVRAGSIW